MQVTANKISAGIQALGITSGDLVLVHSSLRSMGTVQGGADTIIDSFLDIIGGKGTLVMPAFSFIWDKKEEKMIVPPFNVHTSPSNMGLITETFRKRDGVLRSNNPTHSFCAFGPLAHDLTIGEQDPSETRSIPWELFNELGGKVVLLGVHHNRSTIMHHVESLCKESVPYLSVMHTEGGKYRTKTDHAIFNGIEPYLVRHNAIRFAEIGNAMIRCMDGKELVKVAVKVLCEENPSALLCDDPECAFCVWGKRKNACSGDTANPD